VYQETSLHSASFYSLNLTVFTISLRKLF
jgi:hypothetical protein